MDTVTINIVVTARFQDAGPKLPTYYCNNGSLRAPSRALSDFQALRVQGSLDTRRKPRTSAYWTPTTEHDISAISEKFTIQRDAKTMKSYYHYK